MGVAQPGERLIVFGTGFNRPLGAVPAPFPGSTNASDIFGPPAVFALAGTFESGEPFAFELQVGAATNVSLAAPGSPGCP